MLKTATFSSELKAVVKFNSFNLVCKKNKTKPVVDSRKQKNRIKCGAVHMNLDCLIM